MLDIKNDAGTEVSFSELRFGDGGLNFESLQPATAVDNFFFNLEDTTSIAVQCPDTSYLDLTTYSCTTSCDAGFDICYAQSEAIKCGGGLFLNLVGRTCTTPCTPGDTTIQTTTTNTNECTTCLDRYCLKCSV
jgi:hypothetical protein